MSAQPATAPMLPNVAGTPMTGAPGTAPAGVGTARAQAFAFAATIGLFLCVAGTVVFCFNIVLKQFMRPILLALGVTVFLSPLHHHACATMLTWVQWARRRQYPLLLAVFLTAGETCLSVVNLVPVPDSWWDILRAFATSQEEATELFSPVAKSEDGEGGGGDGDGNGDSNGETGDGVEDSNKADPGTDQDGGGSTAPDTPSSSGMGSPSKARRPSVRRLVKSIAKATLKDARHNPAVQYLAGFGGLAVVGMVLVHMVLNVELSLSMFSFEGLLQEHLGALWFLLPVFLFSFAVVFHFSGFHTCAKFVVILIVADWTFVFLSLCSRMYIFSILPFLIVYFGASLVINASLTPPSVSWRGLSLMFCVVVVVDLYGVGYFLLGISVLAAVRVVGIIVRVELERQAATRTLVTEPLHNFWNDSVPHSIHRAYHDYVALEMSLLDWMIDDLHATPAMAPTPTAAGGGGAGAGAGSGAGGTTTTRSRTPTPTPFTKDTAAGGLPDPPTLRRARSTRSHSSNKRSRSKSRGRPRVKSLPTPVLHLNVSPTPAPSAPASINTSGSVSSCVAVALILVLTLAAVLLGVTLSARGYTDMSRLTRASTPKELAGFRDVLVMSQRWTSKPSDIDKTYGDIVEFVDKAKDEISRRGPDIVASFVSSFMLGDAVSKDAVLEAFHNITTAFADVGSPPEALGLAPQSPATDLLTFTNPQGIVNDVTARLSGLATRLASGSVAKELASTGLRFLTAIGAATKITWRLLLSQMIQPMLSILNGFIEGIVFYSVLLLLLLYGSSDELFSVLSLVTTTAEEQQRLAKTIRASMHGVLAFTLKMPVCHGLMMWASYEVMDVNGVLGPCLWSVIAAGIAVVGIAPVYLAVVPGLFELAVQGRSSFAVVFGIVHVLMSQRLSELIADEVQAGMRRALASSGGRRRASPLLHPYVIGLSVYGGWCSMPDVFGVFVGPAAICLLVVLSAAISSSTALKAASTTTAVTPLAGGGGGRGGGTTTAAAPTAPTPIRPPPRLAPLSALN